jgi:hypothetical protein
VGRDRRAGFDDGTGANRAIVRFGQAGTQASHSRGGSNWCHSFYSNGAASSGFLDTLTSRFDRPPKLEDCLRTGLGQEGAGMYQDEFLKSLELAKLAKALWDRKRVADL